MFTETLKWRTKVLPVRGKYRKRRGKYLTRPSALELTHYVIDRLGGSGDIYVVLVCDTLIIISETEVYVYFYISSASKLNIR